MIGQNRVEALSFRRCGDCGLQFTWSLFCPACLTLVPALTELDVTDLALMYSQPGCAPVHLQLFP